MTKVARLYEEERVEAVNKRTLEIAENLVKAGADMLMIMKGTGLTREQIEEIKNNALTTANELFTPDKYIEQFNAFLNKCK